VGRHRGMGDWNQMTNSWASTTSLSSIARMLLQWKRWGELWPRMALNQNQDLLHSELHGESLQAQLRRRTSVLVVVQHQGMKWTHGDPETSPFLQVRWNASTRKDSLSCKIWVSDETSLIGSVFHLPLCYFQDGSRGNEPGRLSSTQVDGRIPVPHSPSQDNQPYSHQTPVSQQVNSHNRSSSLRVKSELNQNEIFLQPRPPLPYQSMELPRNPVLDRLTGKVSSSGGAVRSESYYRVGSNHIQKWMAIGNWYENFLCFSIYRLRMSHGTIPWSKPEPHLIIITKATHHLHSTWNPNPFKIEGESLYS